MTFNNYLQDKADFAIDKLNNIGLINSPDYWKDFVRSSKVEWLNYLIIKAADQISGVKEGFFDIYGAVDKLTTAGVITLPDYWKVMAATYTNVGILIQKLAISLDTQERVPVQDNKEDENRQKFVELAQSFLGYNEWDGSHREIVDTYNRHYPLAMGYRVTYTDSWCATFVSAIAILAGFTNIIPTECSCERQINLFKSMGRFQEDENYTPKIGDIIYYAWDDDWDYEQTDNQRFADHVGIVVSVDWRGDVLVIEGNKNDAVEYRTVYVNGECLRGYGIPDYKAV